ncbi:MAG: hypothetical protein MK510_01860, partial [SAR324 cluster bacterium]|nr:hypothetical protein [SAR324 cluster bacterium]
NLTRLYNMQHISEGFNSPRSDRYAGCRGLKSVSAANVLRLLPFCAILAYNTLRWMALCSGNKILQRWEAATIRTFLIRMAGKWTTGSRQQKLRVPKRMLYNAQWEAWVAVAET